MAKKSSKRKNIEVEEDVQDEEKEVLKSSRRKEKLDNKKNLSSKKKASVIVKEKPKKEKLSKEEPLKKEKGKAGKENDKKKGNKNKKSKKEEEEEEEEQSDESETDNESKDGDEESEDGKESENEQSDDGNNKEKKNLKKNNKEEESESEESEESGESESEESDNNDEKEEKNNKKGKGNKKKDDEENEENEDSEDTEEESEESEKEDIKKKGKGKKRNIKEVVELPKNNSKSTRIGIFYISTNGKTKQIANYIKKQIIKKYNLRVDTVLIEENAKYDLSKYQTIIIGGPVYYGGYSRHLTSFIESNAEYLNSIYTAFFSISCYTVSISSPFEYDPFIKNYLKSTLSNVFKPRITASFGGDFAYSKYSPSLKWVAKTSASQIKQYVKEKGVDITDTSKDHSLTNWKWVDDFINKYISEAVPKKHLIKAKSKL